ncbi:hypothetical protein B0H19DRAFT_1273371 [Mycena capillaripes]|nr:hypothetical protein B0H19DRAFT_1273371 [Mycena capillaripes]
MVGTALGMLALAVGAVQFVAASPALTTLPAPFSLLGAVSAEVLGVDSQGRTTYALNMDETEGSSTIEFITGTLVQGSDDAFFTLSHTSVSETIELDYNCAFNAGNAICSGLDSGLPVTTTIPADAIVLDVAATPAPSGSTPSASGTGPTPSPQPSSQPIPQPSNKPGSSQKTSASILGAFVGVALAMYQSA